jgi:CD2 antigen cytoplasmic tail-binding protein 2
MPARYSAARPKRDGESFARHHHANAEANNEEGPSTKRVKFDVRNPSALVPDAREEDDVLAADVIGVGSGTATKRGAVNIDGYDSDSENERATARRTKLEVDLGAQMDSYTARSAGDTAGDDDADAVDMFALEDTGDVDDLATASKGKALDKTVRFLDDREIEGQEQSSRSGGHVQIRDEVSSDDEEEIQLEMQEEDLDEEVGAGGLKHHAPKIDAFNMRQEQEEGAFDEAGNYVRKAVDPDAVHDKWLEGVSKKEMKKAAAAQEKRDADSRQQMREDDRVRTADLLGSLLQHLERGETAIEALARLGKSKPKDKKTPKWKQKRQGQNGDGTAPMEVESNRHAHDAEAREVKAAIDSITEAADKLLGRDYADIYDTEREMLLREYRSEAGADWIGPSKTEAEAGLWEYRWTDGRDGADKKQGPFEARMMKAWQDAGYFGDGVEFRLVGQEAGGWTRVATFA